MTICSSVADKSYSPVLTIVVSVFNTASYLERTLESICQQKCESLEVICIDDHSTDGSQSIIQKFVSTDSRFISIIHDSNIGTHNTRLEGIEKSSGRYVWLVDGDDSIVPGICNTLVDIINGTDYDVIHIGSRIINEDYLDPKRIEWMENFTKPVNGKLHGEQIFKSCFVDGGYGFNIWNKIFNADFLKRSINEMERLVLPKAQDEYEYFVISHNARSYVGYPKTIGYEYHFGAGVTGHNRLDMESFSRYCGMSKVADAIDRYSADKEEYTKDASKRCRTQLMMDCTTNWFRLKKEERPKFFQEMVASWGATETVGALARLKWDSPDDVTKSLYPMQPIPDKPIRRIATYFHSMHGGGVQRVISKLSEVWTNLGYEVILITDEPEHPNDFQIDPRVKRFCITSYKETNGENYIRRSNELRDILLSNEVDLFITHAWAIYMLLWDMLVCKLNGVKFVIHCHNIFSMLEWRGFNYFASMPSVFKLADGIITLSEVDQRFWSFHNRNTYMVQNPLSFEPSSCIPSELKDNTVLWIGRFAREKKPLDALIIFKMVHDYIPSSTMIMVGEGTEEIKKELQSYVNDNHLSDCVHFIGYVSDVKAVYQRASVFICTSEFEGYLITATEAMCAGVPGVYYEMPYLKIVREGSGFVQVPHGDMESASREICRLLSDVEYRRELGKEARSYAEVLAQYNLSDRWKEILKELEHTKEGPVSDESTDLMWDTLLQFYKRGVVAKENKIKNSHSYRIGRMVTFIPRKILRK